MIRILFLLSLLAVLAVTACSTGRSVQSSSSYAASSAGEVSLQKDFLLVEAIKYHLLGDVSSALALISQSLKRDSLCAACYYLQSDIYAVAGMYDQAVSAVNQARMVDSTNEWYALMQATVNMRMGNLPKSIEQFEEVISSKGYNPSVYLNLANLYAADNNFDGAMAMLDTLDAHEGYNEQVSLVRQQVYYRMGYTDKSLQEAIKLNDFSPNDTQYITLVGDAYAREGDITEAVKYYQQALSIDSLYPPAQYGLLDSYRQKEDYKNFFAELKKLSTNVKISLEEKNRFLTLVVFDQTLGKVGVSWLNAIFEEMSSTHSDDWSFTFLYVSYLGQSGQLEPAINVLESYMAKPAYKDSRDVQELYLSLLSNAQRWDKLIATSDKILKTDGKNVQVYVIKSIGLSQLNRYNESAKTLNAALKHTSDTTQRYEIYAYMGDIYHLMGDEKKSYTCYEKALEINPDGIIVLNNYAYYLGEEGERLTDALRMSKKVIEVEPNNPTYLDTYGWILYKMGLYDEAKNIFRQAMMYGGRSESVLLDHYGDVLLALKEYDTAILYYEFALEAEGVENADVIKEKVEKAKSLR